MMPGDTGVFLHLKRPHTYTDPKGRALHCRCGIGHSLKGINMQTAQINSPRFNYTPAAAAPPSVPHTLDDFRPVHGSYSGSFSGKSSHPVWIAVGMIAVIASIAAGVNMYSESHSAKIETAVSAPHQIVPKTPVAPTAPAIAPAPVEASAAIAAPEALRTPTTSSVISKPTPVVTKKVAPAKAVVTRQPEMVPPSPAIVEPTPTPPPMMREPTVVPAPTPVPDVPPVEPPKL